MPPTPLAGDLGGGAPAQFRVRPDRVVVVLPGREDRSGVRQRCEQSLVQAFVAQPAIEPKAGEANLSTKAFCVGLPGMM